MKARAALAAAVALGLAPALAAHTFYVSLTMVEHNAAARSLEVTMRLFADDLELAVARHAGKPLKHGQAGFDKAVLAYVREALVLRRADGSPLGLAWVGLENRVDITWVYVEAAGVAATEGLTMRNTLFTEVLPEQVNMMQVRDAKGRRAVDFRAGDPFKPF